MKLADKIISERKRAGYSQEELSEMLGVSRQAVSKWEMAQSTPELEKILEMSRIFGVSTDYLLKEELDSPQRNTAMENEQGIESEGESSELRRLNISEAREYIELRKKASWRIAFATFLCILSPIVLFILGAVSESGNGFITESGAVFFGMGTMLVLVAIAVGIFIHEEMAASSFEYLKNGEFIPESETVKYVDGESADFKSRGILLNVIGAVLCIISPTALFVCAFFEESDILAAVMLSVMMGMCGAGVMMFIISGVKAESYRRLLARKKTVKKNGGALREAMETCYWLIVTAAYLAVSFLSGAWHISWIIWVVAAAVAGGVGAILDVVFDK